MKRLLVSVGICFCVAATPAIPISYGPDSLVDGNPYASYVEPALAVSPTDPRKVIAGSMVFKSSITMETFRSIDGGSTWSSTLLPLHSGSLEGDVQAAFDRNGYAYMTGLGNEVDANGRSHNGLYVFGSANAGESFERLGFFQTPDRHSYDHEQLNIDRSNGRYSGRLYMTVLYTLRLPPAQLNGLGLLWSSDGGRTMHGPVLVSRGWSFNSRPQVFADGTVAFPFFHNATLMSTKEVVQVSISHNGGQTFSGPYIIGTRVILSEAQTLKRLASQDYAFDGDSVPQYAVGASSTVYGVWSDMRTGTSRLLFTVSHDYGVHWTRPRVVLTTPDPRDAQYQVSIATNKAGAIGMTWYNSSPSTNTVSEMFAFSTNGGTTFSTPLPISSMPAPLKTPAGSTFASEGAFPAPFGIMLGFTTPGERYPSAGDYMDLSVDGNGAFHPVWIDARTGVNQVWTVTVFPHAPASVPSRLTSKDITTSVAVDTRESMWNPSTHTLTLPIRLRNTSTSTLYPPFTVTVTGTTNPYFSGMKPQVTVLNSDNGKQGVGASFVYTAATLGNLGRLLPGAETAARTWKLKIGNGDNPSLVTHVSGYVP